MRVWNGRRYRTRGRRGLTNGNESKGKTFNDTTRIEST